MNTSSGSHNTTIDICIEDELLKDDYNDICLDLEDEDGSPVVKRLSMQEANVSR